MKISSKIRWIITKIKLGSNFAVPFKGSFIGKIKVVINKSGIFKAGKGFACRDDVLFNISGGEIAIGDNTFLNSGCKLNSRKRIIIGNGCIIGQNVLMYDHDHDYHDLEKLHKRFVDDEIVIGNNVWIGSNVVILKGSIIGDGCVLGAGLIVKGIIEPGMLVYPRQEKVVKKIRSDATNENFVV